MKTNSTKLIFNVLAISVAVICLLSLIVLITTLYAFGYRIHISDWPPIQQVLPNQYLAAAAKSISKLGPVGDYFGGLLNPIVAIGALVGLYLSLNVQRDTLKATRDGLRLQLDQDHFFTLLGNREAAISNISLNKTTPTIVSYRGREVVREVLAFIDIQAASTPTKNLARIHKKYSAFEEFEPQALQRRVSIFTLLYTGDANLPTEKIILSHFRTTYDTDNLEDILGHIFRSTYQVLKFIYETASFDDKKKADLTNYLRAQISEAEFAAFALTALTKIGAKSRAIAIALDLYEDRLQSLTSAEGIPLYFNVQSQLNRKFAEYAGYPVIQKLESDLILKDKIKKIRIPRFIKPKRPNARI